MFSPQSKTKNFVKPSSIPKLSKSSTTSPRLTEVSENSTQISISKSAIVFLLKNLNDISLGLEMLEAAYPSHEILKKCKSSLKGVTEKLQEFTTDDEAVKLGQSKPDEYCLFLEYLVSYEQSRTDIIIQKSKFPKLRMKEIDKILAEEYPCKVSPKSPKKIDISLADVLKKEAKDLVRKSKKHLKDKTVIPKDVEDLLGASIHENLSVYSPEPTSDFESLSYLEESRQAENKQSLNLYESITADHQKLSDKYSYLISRFNKQDRDFKFQSNLLNMISRNLSELKSLYLAYSGDIFSIISDLITKLSSQFFSNSDRIEKNRLKEKCEKLEQTISELEKKVRVSENASDSDSLNLETSLSEMIESQKLWVQIQQLNSKIYESSNSHQKEIENYKAENSKLRAQIFSLEERFENVKQKYRDLYQEKEKLLDEISRFHKTGAEMSRTDLVFSMEKSHVKSADIFSFLSEEVEKIAGILKSSNLFEQYHDNSLNLIKKAIDFLVSLKEDIEEDRYFEQVLEGLVRDRKSKVISQNGDLCTESYLRQMDVETYKIKLKDKKKQIELINQQNDYLKRSLKDLQVELNRAKNEDSGYLKKTFVNIAKEIPLMQADIEQLLIVFMKGIGLDPKEIKGVVNERKAKLIGFFHNVKY